MENPLNDLLQLPKGLDSPDPVDGNPFPESDIRHAFWERATNEAEDEHSRLVADAFKRPRPEDPRRVDAIAAWDIAFFTTRYDIWARRGVRVVLSKELLDGWYLWLANYANETLKGDAARAPSEKAIQALRDSLIGRREHWKAEGRRCVALQKTHQAQLVAAKPTGDISAKLPDLPERVTRMLGIRWLELLETYRLGGDSVLHYASASASTRKIALQNTRDVARGRHLKQWLSSYQRAKRDCGISASVSVAEARFNDLATQYLERWSPGARWELFAGWLKTVRVRVLGEIESLWERTDATKGWYESVCAPTVKAAVERKVKAFEHKAQHAELTLLAVGSKEPQDAREVTGRDRENGLKSIYQPSESLTPAPATDPGDDPARFRRAKALARRGFNAKASEVLRTCADGATYRSLLDEAELQAMAAYTALRNALWDLLSTEMPVGGGEGIVVIGEHEEHPDQPSPSQMEADRLEYRRNLEILLDRLPKRKQYWLARFVSEGGKSIKSVSNLRVQSAEEEHSKIRTPTDPKRASREMFQANEWEQVEILFFNERSVQITVEQGKPSVRDFGELGMAHNRSGKATRAWQALHLLAESEGVVKVLKEKPSDWRFFEKRVQEIRARFRGLFGLSDDPIPFIKGTGYRTKFTVKRAPSYQK